MSISNRAVITNQRYIQLANMKELVGKTKYYQYRDTRHIHIPQGENTDRWQDRGLGGNYGEITKTCRSLATTGLKNDVAARTLVISPETTLMHAIPLADRVRVVNELTEATLDNWFAAMDLPTPEYAYVSHLAEASKTLPDGRDKDHEGPSDFLHTHVVLAATVPGLVDERENYGVWGKQLKLLHAAGRDAMEDIWTRELGPERMLQLNTELETRAQQLEALDRERKQAEMQLDIPAELPGSPERNPSIVREGTRPGPDDWEAWFPDTAAQVTNLDYETPPDVVDLDLDDDFYDL